MNTDEIAPQHYAFLVSEAEFDEISAGFANASLPTGPILRGSNQVRSITTTADAASISRVSNGHLLEIITRPYGSGGWNP